MSDENDQGENDDDQGEDENGNGNGDDSQPEKPDGWPAMKMQKRVT